MPAAQPVAVAFENGRAIARGALADVARAVHAAISDETRGPVHVFDSMTGRIIELDLRGSADEIVGRLAPSPVPARGRPKLGVVAREVTLLPQHWDWLNRQPGGASAVLRRLVDEARRSPEQQRREARDAAYRFIFAVAGDLPGFEEASRALFAGDDTSFEARMADWPADIRAQAMAMLRRGEER